MRPRRVLAGLVTGAVLAASLAACDTTATPTGDLPEQPQVPVQQPDPYGGGSSGGGGSYGGGGSSPVTPPTGPYTPGNQSSPYS